MRTVLLRPLALSCLVLVLPATALAAPKSFPGPAGWDHTISGSPAASGPGLEAWKKGDQSVSVLVDGATPYADVLARVHKNVSDNGLHPAVDRDLTCGGKPAHEIEMSLAGTTFHQVLIDDGTGQGVTRITYSRPQTATPAPDVTGAIASYCAP